MAPYKKIILDRWDEAAKVAFAHHVQNPDMRYIVPLETLPQGTYITLRGGGNIQGVRYEVITTELLKVEHGPKYKAVKIRELFPSDLIQLHALDHDSLWKREKQFNDRNATKPIPTGFTLFGTYISREGTQMRLIYQNSREGVLALLAKLYTHTSNTSSSMLPGFWHDRETKTLYVFTRHVDFELLSSIIIPNKPFHIMAKQGGFRRILFSVGMASHAYTVNVNADGELALYRKRVLTDRMRTLRTEEKNWIEVLPNEFPWIDNGSWSSLTPTFPQDILFDLDTLHTFEPDDPRFERWRIKILLKLVERNGFCGPPHCLHVVNGPITLPEPADERFRHSAVELAHLIN